MMTGLLWLLAGFLLGSFPGHQCGESFCVPADATFAARRTPVPDFNLYDVLRLHQHFVIYEGNFPQTGKTPRLTVKLPMNKPATLAIADERGSVIVQIQDRGWPEFLDINGPCRSAEECPALDLARAITLLSKPNSN